jgi:hypothetical protein
MKRLLLTVLLSAPCLVFGQATPGSPVVLSPSTAQGSSNVPFTAPFYVGTQAYTDASQATLAQFTLTSTQQGNTVGVFGIQGLNSGNAASIDFIAYSDNTNGTSTHFLDMGANSSTNSTGTYPTGADLDFISSASDDLYIGTIGSNTLHLFAASTDILDVTSAGVQVKLLGIGSAPAASQGIHSLPTLTGSSQVGINSNPTYDNTGTTIVGIQTVGTDQGTVGTHTDFQASNPTVSGSLATFYGFNASASSGPAATNNYAYGSNWAAASGTYNLYMVGTAQNLLAGVTNFSATTSASSSTTGSVTIGNGTASTNVGIGGGNVNAGGTIISGGNMTDGGISSAGAVISTAGGLLSSQANSYSGYLTGTAYTMTGSSAAITGGTTSPAVTLSTAGTYLIQGGFVLEYVAATYAANQTATIKFRRTNNTATDLTNATTTVELRVLTTLTDNAGSGPIPAVIYTATAGDAISVFGTLSATPSAGSVTANVGTWILATRLY